MDSVNVSLCWTVALVLALGTPWGAGAQEGAASYEYSQNIEDFMASGERFFQGRKFHEAEVDFENVLTLDPSHAQGLVRLYQTRVRLGRLDDAEALLERIRSELSLETGTLETLESELRQARSGGVVGPSAGGGSPAPPPYGVEPPAPPEPPVAREAADPVPAPEVEAPFAEEGPSPEELPPAERFERALRRARARSYSQAIPLYVSAVREDPSLLARDDEGLRDISRQYYENRVAESPREPRLRFILGWFQELESQLDQAMVSYQTVVQLADPGSKLSALASVKIEEMQALKNQMALAEAEAAREEREAERQLELDQAATGTVEGLASEDYLKRAQVAFERWKAAEDGEALKEAVAYLEGATIVSPKDPEVYLSLAKAKIDQAIGGEPGAREQAKLALEQVLRLSPNPAQERQANTLLQSMSGSTDGGGGGSGGGPPPPGTSTMATSTP